MEILKKLKTEKFKKRFIITLVIYLLYQLLFFVVEKFDLDFTYLHHWLDDYIIFNEFFIIPYISWFFYLGFSLFYFALEKERESEYFDYLLLLFGGMTLCLIINMLWPTALNLRPKEFPRDNIFTSIVRLLHKVDTPTNVCPSIHVYATLIAHLCLINWSNFGKKWQNRAISFFIMSMIVLSTVYLKQHSVIDVFWGLILGFALYLPYNRFFKDKLFCEKRK